jgi:hypothetical protein
MGGRGRVDGTSILTVMRGGVTGRDGLVSSCFMVRGGGARVRGVNRVVVWILGCIPANICLNISFVALPLATQSITITRMASVRAFKTVLSV